MISAKILVQSTAAGLMAGAVVLTPLFLLDSVEDDFARPPSTQLEASQLTQREAQLHEQATLRAAPPVVSQRKRGPMTTDQRSLSERNQAARRALTDLEQTPVPTVGDHLGADLPVSLQRRIEEYKQSQQVASQIDSRSEQSRQLSRHLIESLAADNDLGQAPSQASAHANEQQLHLRR